MPAYYGRVKGAYKTHILSQYFFSRSNFYALFTHNVRMLASVGPPAALRGTSGTPPGAPGGGAHRAFGSGCRAGPRPPARCALAKLNRRLPIHAFGCAAARNSISDGSGFDDGDGSFIDVHVFSALCLLCVFRLRGGGS